jgi:hypothetical protein
MNGYAINFGHEVRSTPRTRNAASAVSCGGIGLWREPVTASARSLPAWICGSAALKIGAPDQLTLVTKFSDANAKSFRCLPPNLVANVTNQCLCRAGHHFTPANANKG